MVGITSYGSYVPYSRMARSVISKMWNSYGGNGERAVANFDEDSVTMSVAAGMDCLLEKKPGDIDRVYLASTTFPYLEKQSSSIVAAALDLRPDLVTLDFSGSLRSGTGALRAAVDAVKGGSANNILVCASDVRMGFPNSAHEKNFGDGAGALLIGNQNIIAEIEACYGTRNEIMDVWRSDKDLFVRSWEERFVRDAGYESIVPATVSAALKKYGMVPESFSKVIFSAPNRRYALTAVKKCGFDPSTKMQDLLDDTIGDTGTALPIMLLNTALEEGKAGDRFLFVSYGDGCDVFILKITDEIEKTRNNMRRIGSYISSKRMIGYDKYLQWRQVLPMDPPRRPPADQSRPSAPALLRDVQGGLALYGVKCRNCGRPQYPSQRVCYNCRTKDDFEAYRFADKAAKVTSFSHDMLSASVDPPTTVCAVDFDGGGRIMCDMTDRDPEEVQVDMPVDMTFRRLFYGAYFYTYWWKCRPLR